MPKARPSMFQENSCTFPSSGAKESHPNTVPLGDSVACPQPSPHLILALTSSGSQMTVEGNISLAHGQEVRADI